MPRISRIYQADEQKAAKTAKKRKVTATEFSLCFLCFLLFNSSHDPRHFVLSAVYLIVYLRCYCEPLDGLADRLFGVFEGDLLHALETGGEAGVIDRVADADHQAAEQLFVDTSRQNDLPVEQLAEPGGDPLADGVAERKSRLDEHLDAAAGHVELLAGGTG